MTKKVTKSKLVEQDERCTRMAKRFIQAKEGYEKVLNQWKSKTFVPKYSYVVKNDLSNKKDDALMCAKVLCTAIKDYKILSKKEDSDLDFILEKLNTFIEDLQDGE